MLVEWQNLEQQVSYDLDSKFGVTEVWGRNPLKTVRHGEGVKFIQIRATSTDHTALVLIFIHIKLSNFFAVITNKDTAIYHIFQDLADEVKKNSTSSR